jgi:hypothetical protein
MLGTTETKDTPRRRSRARRSWMWIHLPYGRCPIADDARVPVLINPCACRTCARSTGAPPGRAPEQGNTSDFALVSVLFGRRGAGDARCDRRSARARPGTAWSMERGRWTDQHSLLRTHRPADNASGPREPMALPASSGAVSRRRWQRGGGRGHPCAASAPSWRRVRLRRRPRHRSST